MNEINLEQVLSERGTKSRLTGQPKVLRAIKPSVAAELQMEQLFTSMLRDGAVLLRRKVMPLFSSAKAELATDALVEDDLMGIVRALEEFRKFLEMRGLATPEVRAILIAEEQKHRKAFQASVRATTGVDVEAVLRASDVRAQISLAVEAHVSLIRGISDELVKRVSTVVLDAARRGLRQSELAKSLAKQFKWSQTRARLIARDQLASYNASLNKVRQTQLGIKRYRWSTSLDERVRPEHAAREGKIYAWSRPPRDGHPGEPINCRCIAEAIV